MVVTEKNRIIYEFTDAVWAMISKNEKHGFEVVKVENPKADLRVLADIEAQKAKRGRAKQETS